MNTIISYTPEELRTIIRTEILSALKEAGFGKKDELEPILNMKQVTEYLHVKDATIKKYASSGKLKRAMPKVKGYRFYISEIQKFAQGYRD